MSEDTETVQPNTNASGEKPWPMDLNQYCMFMHLSQFIGLLVPLVLWLINKKKDPSIDQHGKNIINWWLSSLIYWAGGAILAMVIVGFFVMFAVLVCSIIFTIMAAVKANKGEVWAYPMSIKFLK